MVLTKGGWKPMPEEMCRQIGAGLVGYGRVLESAAGGGIQAVSIRRGWTSAEAEAAALSWMQRVLVRRMTAVMKAPAAGVRT